MGDTRPSSRDAMRVYQGTSRVWLTVAVCSLLLPASVRLEWWVPLHLALLGAVSVAISGAMQNFVSVLTATPPPPRWMVRSQFGLVNSGAASIVVGRATHDKVLLAGGGALFLSGILLLGAMVIRALRKALHLRHRVPVAMYGAAVACLALGGAIGVRIGVSTGVGGLVGLRSAHMILNVLGWVSLTIVGTLITMLPTVLRVRMPDWRGNLTAGSLVAGVLLMAAGLVLHVEPAFGAAVFAAGVLGFLAMVRKVIAVPRRWPVPVSAKHLFLAIGWLALGSVLLVLSYLPATGRWFANSDDVFAITFVCGWTLQTLLGVWQYLLAMIRPGHPDERRGSLASMEWGAAVQLVALNLGLLCLVVAAAVGGLSFLARVGAALALLGVSMALVKVWAFPAMGKLRFFTRGSRPMWDPAAGAQEP